MVMKTNTSTVTTVTAVCQCTSFSLDDNHAKLAIFTVFFSFFIDKLSSFFYKYNVFPLRLFSNFSPISPTIRFKQNSCFLLFSIPYKTSFSSTTSIKNNLIFQFKTTTTNRRINSNCDSSYQYSRYRYEQPTNSTWK